LSGAGADSGEMRDRRSLSDQDLDRLLAGKAPSGGDAVDRELATFVRDVRTAFLAPPAAETERMHLAAAMAASHLNVDKGDPAVRPASKAHGPDRQASGLPKWRRRTVLSSLFASLTAKIAGVAIAAAAATGGLAAAGALPAPVQQAVASAASNVGINLPNPNATKGLAEKAVHAPGPAPTSTVASDNAAVTATASDSVNHGFCVSYATSIATSLGLSGSEKGQFISAVSQDPSALSAQVSTGGTPDAACQTSIDKAKAAVSAPGQSGATHGKPAVTATATAGAGNNPTGYGQTSHPGATSNPGTGANPTGYGPTSYPTGKP
jgi:hypothetical protein